jgi:hypothetical protein
VKTAVEIPDLLFRRAKSAAAGRGIALLASVPEALADKLRAREQASTKGSTYQRINRSTAA